MARYRKQRSAYIKRSLHQSINGALILENDWMTIGSKVTIGPGKHPCYQHGNFVFTVSPTNPRRRRSVICSRVNEYTWENVKDATGRLSDITVEGITDDLRDFAYYGSAVDLVTTSVENIVAQFPASAVVTENQRIEVGEFDGTEYLRLSKADFYDEESTSAAGDPALYGLCLLKNPYGIDFYSEPQDPEDVYNPLRYFASSFENYNVVVKDASGEKLTLDIQSVEAKEYGEGECSEELQWYGNPGKRRHIHIVLGCADNAVFHLHGFQVEDSILFFTPTKLANEDGEPADVSDGSLEAKELKESNGYKLVSIQPKEAIIEEYFAGLKGFERLLLRRDTTPCYANTWKAPIRRDEQWYIGSKYCSWPVMSDGVTPQAEGVEFMDFINSIYEIAQNVDQWCADNIWRKMTHEAIKNFDEEHVHYYPNQQTESESQFEEGGKSFQVILRMMGRVFDDSKHFIDGIYRSRQVSLSGINNMPDAQLSDKLEEIGFCAPSINAALRACIEESESEEIDDNESATDGEDKTAEGGDATTDDTKQPDESLESNFLRRLIMFSRRMRQSKGTLHGIAMMLAMFGLKMNEDYEVQTRYYQLKTVEYDSSSQSKEIPAEGVDTIGEDDSEAPTDDENKATGNDDAAVVYDLSDEGASREFEAEYKKCLNDAWNREMASAYTESENPFDGIPLRDAIVYTNKETWHDLVGIVPYFQSGATYDKNLYFQSRGGWGKNDTGNYKETIPYLRSVANVQELLSLTSSEVEGGEIIYIYDITDIAPADTSGESFKGNGGEVPILTHFAMVLKPWYLDDKGYDGWYFVPEWRDGGAATKEDKIKYYDTLGNATEITQEEIAAKCEYLNSLMPDMSGNNPHSGYGTYDGGELFIDYMRNPLKADYDREWFTLKQIDITEGPCTEGSDRDMKCINNPQTWNINDKHISIVFGRGESTGATKVIDSVIAPYLEQMLPSTALTALTSYQND